MYNNKYKTDILFSRTNTVIGMGSVFNLAGRYFEFSNFRLGQKSDYLALRSDWEMVGNDIRSIIRKNPKQNTKKKI